MQGNRFLLAAISGLTILAFANSAWAVMSVPYGWFVEANAGSSKLSNKSYPGSSSGSSGIGGNINVGYKFMPYLGAEIGYSMYSNTTVEDATDTKAGTDKHYSYHLAARGILPIGCSGFEAFGKIGVARVASSMDIDDSAAAASIGLASSSHSATGLYLGVGAQYYIMPELAIVAQWQRAEGSSSTGNEDLLSAGLSFIFD